jgi:hypothetical protein
MRAQEQMIRIHARSYVALVADYEARRNLTPKELPRQPMRRIHLSLEADHAIPGAHNHPAP